MASTELIEKRVAAVEQAVAELQQKLGTGNWVERFRGSFKDEPAFDEIVQYGREARQADRPPQDVPR
jgi:hypothetical protein